MSKREQILEAALQLFMEKGFEKTPTSAISKTAGVATGTLFHHFKTKDELINALYLEIKMEMRDAIQAHASQDNSIKSRFLAMCEAVMEWVLVHPEKFRFMAQFGNSAFIASSTRERVDQAFEESLSMLEEGMQNGTLNPLPVELMNLQLASNLMASADYLLKNPQYWQDRDFRQMVLQSFWQQIARYD
ncbi:TetR/AcrR family transcriptional regulator [Spongorhabdus nitratireducens]